MKATKAEVIQAIIEKGQPPIFDYLEAEIGDKTDLCGDAFSIADIAITCQFIQMQYAGEQLPADSHPGRSGGASVHLLREIRWRKSIVFAGSALIRG